MTSNDLKYSFIRLISLFEASKLQFKFDCNCVGKLDQYIIKSSTFTMEDKVSCQKTVLLKEEENRAKHGSARLLCYYGNCAKLL